LITLTVLARGGVTDSHSLDIDQILAIVKPECGCSCGRETNGPDGDVRCLPGFGPKGKLALYPAKRDKQKKGHSMLRPYIDYSDYQKSIFRLS
jgi:hypothetical protein